MFRGTVQTIHFVGIGGIGMSGIAEVLLTLGFRVTGSDLKASTALDRLQSLGAIVYASHAAEHVGQADVVVRSTAVHADNVEIVTALARGIPVIRRAEMLAELMRLKYGIAIAGSHGKTTITSMVAAILATGGLDPTVVIGGRLDQLGGSNARLGQGEYLVAEADESDGTFNLLHPTVALVSNIDPEHMDHFETVAVLEAAFQEFASKVPFYGFAVLCADHPAVLRLLPLISRRTVSYGLSELAEYHARDLVFHGMETSFTVFQNRRELGRITLAMPGRHNVQNAVGAVALTRELQIPFDVIQSALHGFGGVQRRFTVRADRGGVLIVDDYGHHPAEVAATLQAARDAFAQRRLIAVFQPHRYTRLSAFWKDFAQALAIADEVILCPVYPAGEAPIPGIGPELVAGAFDPSEASRVHLVPSLDQAVATVRSMVRSGDLVITLGAGDVHRVCEGVAQGLSS